MGRLPRKPSRTDGSLLGAHLYYANWGTRILMLRLPLSWLDLNAAAEYCNDETFSARRSGTNIVLEFHSEVESGDDWGYEIPGSLGAVISRVDNMTSAGTSGTRRRRWR